MITNLIPSILLAALFIMSSCAAPKDQDKPYSEMAKPPLEEVRKGATDRHARVGMNTTKMAEDRRLVLAKIAEATPFYRSKDGALIYYKSETIPTYTGGNPAIALFLEKNLKYPSNKEENREGTIFVDFIINADGSIRNVNTTDSTFAGNDEVFRKEAKRLVDLMPKWNPGRQQGKPVDVKYSVAITFLVI
jgi:protein TonB